MDYRNLFNFTGHTVLITGGGGTLGREFAKAFYRCGADIMVADINPEASRETVEACHRQSCAGRAESLQVDLRDIDSIETMVQQTVATFGKVDVLCNHAGLNIRKPAADYTPSEWETIVDLNLRGSYFTAQKVGRTMIANGGGRIINTASVSAVRGHKNLSIYAATKGGIHQYTKVLAHEWAPYNITVNAVGPGYVLTQQTAQYLNQPEIKKALLERIPMKRFGRPEEIASTVLFLASEGAAYITGQTIFIEGGRLVD